jgi:hypothetical protein
LHILENQRNPYWRRKKFDGKDARNILIEFPHSQGGIGP